MKNNQLMLISLALTVLLVIGCATKEEGQQVRRGAVVGAAAGLALGAITGDPEMMAIGAAAGAGTGAMYEYEQIREDRRTQVLADSIGGAKKGETVDDAGNRHLEDLMGDWDISIWIRDKDGKKITGSGKAKGVMVGKGSLKIDFSDITAEGYDQTVTGTSMVNYSAEKGFTLNNSSSETSGDREYVGEYLPEKNAYNFYPLNDKDKKTVSGTIRSNLRVELRISGSSLFVAETYAMIDGTEVQIQSYRFTKQ